MGVKPAVQAPSVDRLDDPRLLSAVDGATLALWAAAYLALGFKPLPKANGAKHPPRAWHTYQDRTPAKTATPPFCWWSIT